MCKKGVYTEHNPTPVRTPKFRTIHQRKAPTSPAAPVPEAKYLVEKGQILQFLSDR